MKILHIIILTLVIIVGTEIYILNTLNVVKPTHTINTAQNIRIATTNMPSPTSYIMEIQNRSIDDLKTYMKAPGTPKKKMVTALFYTGWVKSVVFNKTEVTIVVGKENGEKIERYLNWGVDSFVVYKRSGDNLLKVRLKDLKAENKISIREFEEIAQNSMDPKKILSYVEIIIEK